MSERPIRKRRRKDGKLVPIKSPHSANNGKLKKIQIRHGGTSALLAAEGVIAESTRERHFERHHIANLVTHLGGPGEVTEPERKLCQVSARLELLQQLIWAEVLRSGVASTAGMAPALAAYLVVVQRQIDVLRTLGLRRRAKRVPSLQEILRSEPETIEQEQSE